MKALKLFLLASAVFALPVFSQFFWTEQVSGVSVSLNSVSNIDGNKAWVCGNNSTVLRTVNGGYNWLSVGNNGIPPGINLTHIFGRIDSTAYTSGITGGTAYIYRTTNFGSNWQQIFSLPNGKINGIYFNGNSGIIIGDPIGGRWSIWKTGNNGNSWDSSGMYVPQAGIEKGFYNSFWPNINKLIFGTDNSRIYFSSNYGNNWISLPTSPVTNIYNLWMDQNFLNGISAGDSLLRSTNTGLSWQVVTGAGNGIYNNAVGLNSSNYYWFIRSSQNIYTAFSIPFWSVQYTAPSGLYTALGPFRSGFIGGPGAIYAIRDNGGISRLNYFVEGVTIISGEIPEAYELYQNFPNPFNSSTVFKFEIPKLNYGLSNEVRGGYVKIVTYNALGQQVNSLVNEVLQPGIYKVEWNGNDLASGVYYYRLLVTDPLSSKIIYSLSRKMVMIK